MKIQIFKNNKGLIHGADPKRIGCGIEGTLRIGKEEIKISPESESIMPVLLNGCNAVSNATFTSAIGCVYELDKVTIKGGRIVPPTPIAVELMELRCKTESLEAENEALKADILELRSIFDTNSLNFLIK